VCTYNYTVIITFWVRREISEYFIIHARSYRFLYRTFSFPNFDTCTKFEIAFRHDLIKKQKTPNRSTTGFANVNRIRFGRSEDGEVTRMSAPKTVGRESARYIYICIAAIGVSKCATVEIFRLSPSHGRSDGAPANPCGLNKRTDKNTPVVYGWLFAVSDRAILGDDEPSRPGRSRGTNGFDRTAAVARTVFSRGFPVVVTESVSPRERNAGQRFRVAFSATNTRSRIS